MWNQLKVGLRTAHGKKLMLLTTALLLIAAGLTVSARACFSSESTRAESLPSKASEANASTAQQEHGVIRLLTSGFSPTELSGASGQYRLVVTRPSRDEQVLLQLKTEGGELVQEIEMPQEKLSWTTLIELEAGSYTLTVTNHPQWICHITVQ